MTITSFTGSLLIPTLNVKGSKLVLMGMACNFTCQSVMHVITSLPVVLIKFKTFTKVTIKEKGNIIIDNFQFSIYLGQILVCRIRFVV